MGLWFDTIDLAERNNIEDFKALIETFRKTIEFRTTHYFNPFSVLYIECHEDVNGEYLNIITKIIEDGFPYVKIIVGCDTKIPEIIALSEMDNLVEVNIKKPAHNKTCQRSSQRP
jgi:hypothetical protein